MNKWTVGLLAGIITGIAGFFIAKEWLGKSGPVSYEARCVVSVTQMQDKLLKGKLSLSLMEGALQERCKQYGKDYTMEKKGSSSFAFTFRHLYDTLGFPGYLFTKGNTQFREIVTADVLPELLRTIKPIADSLNTIKGIPKQDSALSDLEELKKNVTAQNNAEHNQVASVDYGNTESIHFPDAMMNDRGGWKAGPVFIFVKEKDTAVFGDILRSARLQDQIPANIFYCYGKQQQERSQWYLPLYFIRGQTDNEEQVLGNADIAEAHVSPGYSDNYAITLSFTPKAKIIWQHLTARNVNKYIAVMADSIIVSAPEVIMEIPDGMTSISGRFSREEANTWAGVLRMSPLPEAPAVSQIEFSKETGNLIRNSLFLGGVCFLLFGVLGWFLFKTLKNT